MLDSQGQTRVTLRTIQKWVRMGDPFPMLTCYDATTARLLVAGGVNSLLVGDTAAEMILGYDSTLPVKMEFMVEITAAVRRGAPNAFIMADMPFGSYQAGDDLAMENAVRFIQDGSADCVKLEVDASFGELVGRMSRAGIPVVPHIGSRPQQVRKRGYGSAGRSKREADEIVEAATVMARQGASMILLEAVPAEVAQRVVECAVLPDTGEQIPVIGCGGGAACHGHVVVLHDLLGLTDWQPPFAKPVVSLGASIQEAAATWANLVRSKQYLSDEHPYQMDESQE